MMHLRADSCRKGIKRIFWEFGRCFGTVWFPVSVLGTAVLFLMDAMASPETIYPLERFKEASGLPAYIDGWTEGFLFFVGLGLCTFYSTGLYAQDREENILLMRLGRVGDFRYSLQRVLQVFICSFVCGFLVVYIIHFFFYVIYGVPFYQDFYRGDGTSRMLSEGDGYLYLFLCACMQGLLTTFYAELTLLFSLFVRNLRLLAIFPVMLQYILQHIFGEWLGIYFSPQYVYDPNMFLKTSFLNSEWRTFAYICLYTIEVALAVWLVFLVKLGADRRRKRL